MENMENVDNTENKQNGKQFWGMELNTFSMLMHLSQFAGWILPGAGLAMPLIMWLTNKDESEVIDAHGKNIVNWIISMVIYAIVSSILIFVFIGILMLVALGILSLIFIIMGTVKANNGEVWKYPLAIPFIK